jgi:orotate phosphoribosyltransferase
LTAPASGSDGHGDGSSLPEELIELLSVRKGHFRLESGHHGDLWLDLDLLFLRPAQLMPFVRDLAGRLSGHHVDAVCGPLTGGAFLAQTIASELDVEFCYSERSADPPAGARSGVDYRLPEPLRGAVRDRDVAIVDDVVNAGSAVRATMEDLRRCGANPVVVGSLLVLGRSAPTFISDSAISVSVECVARLASGLWTPSECPLCGSDVPLDEAGAGTR